MLSFVNISSLQRIVAWLIKWSTSFWGPSIQKNNNPRMVDFDAWSNSGKAMPVWVLFASKLISWRLRAACPVFERSWKHTPTSVWVHTLECSLAGTSAVFSCVLTAYLNSRCSWLCDMHRYCIPTVTAYSRIQGNSWWSGLLKIQLFPWMFSICVYRLVKNWYPH